MMDDIYISIGNIRAGDIVWECESGQDAALLALSDPAFQDQGTLVQMRDILTGKAVQLFQGHQAGGYGPRLYRLPQYTIPDWPALLTRLARIAHHEATEQRLRSEAHQQELTQRAAETIDALHGEQVKVLSLTAECAALQTVIERVNSICDVPSNGITLAQRIRAITDGIVAEAK